MRKRRLVLEALEKRLVLSGVGQSDAGWQSVIVSLKDDVADADTVASALVNFQGGNLGHVYQHVFQGFSAYLPDAAIDALSQNPLVESIEVDQVVQACGWPSGTPYVVPTGVDRIDAELSTTQDYSDVNVAILDTGIDPDHPDLNVNDVGVRFYTRGRSIKSDGNFADDAGHGSHVAGIVGAIDNTYGVTGVAPGATVWPVKVLDSRGYGSVETIAAGIDWVVAQGGAIDVINMSLGLTGESSVLHTAVQGAVDAGIVVVVAAGNDGLDVYGEDGELGGGDDFIPAAYPEVITVSAMVDTDGIPGGLGADTLDGLADDSFAAFSNYGSAEGAIDLMCPGVDIWSCWYDGSYVELSGTSMAAPHATGLVARYIAENPDDAGDVAAIRSGILANSVAQDSPLGLINGGDPDLWAEPIGWAADLPADGDYPPLLKLTAPDAGATMSGTADDPVVVEAVIFNDQDDISDGSVTGVKFYAALWTPGGVGVQDVLIEGNVSNVGNTWAVEWDTSEFADGLYRLTATATEDSAQSGVSTPIFVTVTTGTVSDSTMHVASIAGIPVPANRGRWQARVTVTVEDGVDAALAGAIVTGAWTGGTTGTVSGVTGSDGTVTFLSKKVLTAEPITFTVTDLVLADYEYVPGENVSVTIDPPEAALARLSAAQTADLDALYQYLTETSEVGNRSSAAKNANGQVALVDLIMAEGM